MAATQSEFRQIVANDSREWQFVTALIRDVQQESDREELASLFGQWRLSIKAFRRAEERRMVRSAPTPLDLKFHKAGAAELISFGTLLQIGATEHKTQDLEQHGFNKQLLDALLRDLHNTFDEWHGQISDERLNLLSEEILNAPATTDLRDSRTEVQTQESKTATS
jgi:hypothetical protein